MADARRAGSYFLRNVPLEEARERWSADRDEQACPLRVERERVALAEARGRVTAEPVFALRSSPAYDGAAMDGVALRASETLGASESSPVLIEPTAYEHVDTGDPMPDGYDAVVMREHVHFSADKRAELRAPVAPYQHVRSLGEDVAETELLLPPGHRIRPIDAAACASAGHTTLSVRRRPRVAIVPTGDELRPLGNAIAAGEIADTNSLMLAGQAEDAGATAAIAPIVPDDPMALRRALEEAAHDADVVAVLAGSSAGRDDHTANVVAAAGTLSVHGVAVKPGHPVVLGVVENTPVVGVPGYPVSAALTFELLIGPLLAELQGTTAAQNPRAQASVARKISSVIGVEDWVRVRLGQVCGTLVAAPLAGGAGVLTSLVRADGLLKIGAEREGHDLGDTVDVELLRPLEEIVRAIVCTGSHDLVLDLAAATMRERRHDTWLSSTAVGSLGGLLALRDGLCHVAGAHLLDEASGDYNLPFVERLLGDEQFAVIRLAHRDQGLMVAPGNPLAIASLDDLAHTPARYVNRQRGAGTRVLLDYELAKRGVASSAVRGYEREEYSHLAVAAAIAAGRADCGLGILAAARAFELDFVPVASEPFDLVMRTETLDDPTVEPLLSLLADEKFRTSVSELGGYDVAEMGRRVL
ncbi:MAG: molybdopterin biosynthesis protein [Gaiellaceae bacterium]